jgi:hypothetical protein
MIQCLVSFLELCYVFCRNAITTTALKLTNLELEKFHQLREVFVETGTRSTCSLPRQHGLKHFLTSIPLFGSPNGLCSSITESRHITAVKEPWRWSSRYNALSQMLTIITRLDKLSALHRILSRQGMLQGTTAMQTALAIREGATLHGIGSSIGCDDESSDSDECSSNCDADSRLNDTSPEGGPRLASSVTLAVNHGMCV